jgi:hypothetical protein
LNDGCLVIVTNTSLFSIFPSDDLFDDDESETKKAADETPEGPKRKYLDQKWKLNAEDAKEFKGFPSKEAAADEIPENVPCFALMYRFRREYYDNSCDEALADHNSYCLKFKRLLSSEVIKMKNNRGAVLLWAGYTETDKAETKAEITSFLEDDPLITKDIVENWDIIDFEEVGGSEDALPASARARA